MQLTANHLAFLAADRGLPRQAAVLDGFAEANRTRPEAGIYTRHYERYRQMYRTALGDECEAALAEGAASDLAATVTLMLTVAGDLRAGLES
ncbi:MAG: hypothetical protein GWN07_41270 [Actinobacteria bacterium]|nr:hypothetical protein [Actinomycetota bacterium]NIS37445.1 hypothetical protein [Actinomycetota bacterium]NIU66586.1 hypothetical protein [Actinomycetota bacterium]NIW28390.1 hypothetical protein [Actinomycetota bacterium]NIX25907.1 hypothetical protein [Actinomycetota bacterium]